MKVLGISSDFHDSSAAIICDGKIVAAAAEERFSLIKHDSNFPSQAIDFCITKANCSTEEIDSVVFYENTASKMGRAVTSLFLNYPYSRKQFSDFAVSWISSKLWIRSKIASRLNLSSGQIQTRDHHESHAEQAFYTSNFQSAAILIADGVGEWDCTSLYIADRAVQNSLRKLESIEYPHSLGLVYAAFTAFLGFQVNEAECSTMALAAFGEPRFLDSILSNLIHINQDGTYHLEPSYFCFEGESGYPFTKKFIQLFGQPRDPKKVWPFDIQNRNQISSEDQKYADIAASIQKALELALISLCTRLRDISKQENLCFAGGVAFNCVAVEKIVQSGIFKEVFVPTDPGDGGASIGAAISGARIGSSNSESYFSSSPFLGAEFDEAEALRMLSFLNPNKWPRFQELQPPVFQKMKTQSFSIFENLAEQVVAELESGKIVAWFDGAFEFGPRALGHRSILSCPSRSKNFYRLNQKVKLRDSFRPYALSVSHSNCGEVLVNPPSMNLRYMQSSALIKPDFREKVLAARHVDGSTRPQICLADENPNFEKLIQMYHARTGIPGLLNTSFNESGFPMIANVEQALLMFIRTDVDCLVLNGRVLIQKVY